MTLKTSKVLKNDPISVPQNIATIREHKILLSLRHTFVIMANDINIGLQTTPSQNFNHLIKTSKRKILS